MTSTVERRPPVGRTPPARRSAAARQPAARGLPSVLAPGGIAAAWALGAGLVACTLPVLLIWAADSRSGADAVEATKTAVQLWLLAHGSALSVPGGVIGLVPLGLTALPLGLLHRAGRHTVRLTGVSSPGPAGRLVVAVALPYALAATCLTAVAATAGVQPAPVKALLGALAVALVGAGSGVVREARLTGQLDRLPSLARSLARAAGGATAVLLGSGLLLVLGSLVVHASQVASLAGATGPGAVGGVALLVLQVLLAPNAAVWGAAWFSGVGFAVGVGTEVSPRATTLGDVPVLPLLGALPATAPPSWFAFAALAVPLLAGVAGAVLLLERTSGNSLRRAALTGALVGPCTGLLLMALTWMSGGPLGGGRLAAVGPSPWQVGLAVAVQVAVWSALTSVLLTHRRR